jgi:hypothetical protein
VIFILLAVIAFFVLDFFILRAVLRGQTRASQYGTVAVPGEARLTLPAGRVTLTYQESISSSGGPSDTVPFYVPDGLVTTLCAANGGAPLELSTGVGHNASTMASFMPGGPRSRVRIGQFQVPTAGEYVLRAEGAPPDATVPVVLAG